MRRWLLGAAFAGAGSWAATSACSFESLNPSETDAVITVRDQTRDYSKIRTYALGQKVTDLCQLKSDEESEGPTFPAGGAGGVGGMASQSEFDSGNCVEVDHKKDALILQTIADNMDELGYRRIDDLSAEEPDVVLFVGIMAREDRLLSTTAWCNPFVGFTGCWVPFNEPAYGLRDGSLLVEMVDVERSEDGLFTSAWTFVAQGLLSRFNPPREPGDGGGLVSPERVESAINQGFEQSPYLVKGGAK